MENRSLLYKSIQLLIVALFVVVRKDLISSSPLIEILILQGVSMFLFAHDLVRERKIPLFDTNAKCGMMGGNSG